MATFTSNPQSTDGHGQAVGVEPLVIRNVPCALRPLTGREAEQARQMEASVSHVAEIGTGGYEITPYMTMTIGSTVFDIESAVVVDPIMPKWTIRCVERVAL